MTLEHRPAVTLAEVSGPGRFAGMDGLILVGARTAFVERHGDAMHARSLRCARRL